MLLMPTRFNGIKMNTVEAKNKLVAMIEFRTYMPEIDIVLNANSVIGEHDVKPLLSELIEEKRIGLIEVSSPKIRKPKRIYFAVGVKIQISNID